MSKKRCKVKLWIIAVLTLLGIVLTFVSFVIPTTNTTYNGFFNSINFGYDVNGGKLAVYKVDDDSLSQSEIDIKLNNTISKINSSFSGLGFNATKQGEQIRIEISNADYNDVEALYTNYQIDIFSLLGSDEGLTFSSSSSDGKADGYVDGSYISKCYVEKSNCCVKIEFTEEGKTKFYDLTQSIIDDSGLLYIYFDGTAYGSSISYDNLKPYRTSLDLYYENVQVANAISYEINALAKPVTLSQVSNNVITSGLNSSARGFFGNQKTLLLTAICLLFVASLVFLSLRYKMFGILSIMANLIFIVIYSFLLQSIPLVSMDFNGVLGALFIYGLLVLGEVEIFEKIRQEYALGKKIPNSVKSGFKKNVLPTLEKYVFGLIFASVLYIVGSTGFKALAVNVFVGLFVNYLILFAILRGIIALYMPINSTNKKSFNLKREGKRNEV